MSASVWKTEEKVSGPLLTDASGNAIFDIDVSTLTDPVAADQQISVWYEVKAGAASGAHMTGVYCGVAEAAYYYKGASPALTALTVTTNSANPLASTTATYAGVNAEGVDATTFGTTCSSVLTISGTTIIRLTVNIKNAGGGNIQNASVMAKYRLTRWGIT